MTIILDGLNLVQPPWCLPTWTRTQQFQAITGVTWNTFIADVRRDFTLRNVTGPSDNLDHTGRYGEALPGLRWWRSMTARAPAYLGADSQETLLTPLAVQTFEQNTAPQNLTGSSIRLDYWDGALRFASWLQAAALA